MLHLPKNDPETYAQLADMVRDFADAVIRPAAGRLDQNAEFPRDIYSQMADLGLFGVTVPDDLGGAGMDVLAYSLVMEELARGYASVADQCGVVELIGTLLARYGTPAQQKAHLPGILRAETIIAYCITEEEAGSDVAGLRTTATRTEDGWRLNGSKLWIHNAPLADLGFVLARTDPAAGHRGMSIFIVDLHASGVERGPREHKLGQRASQIGALSFSDVALPDDALLGELNRGFHIMMSVLEKGRVGIAALATGIAQAGLEAALDYAGQRKQFGKALVDHQGLQWMLADMAKDIAAARALVRDAALKLDNGAQAGMACSIAKCFASDICVAQTANALQIFGGSGYIQGFEVERLYRDAKITQIYEGTNQIQRTIIGRELVRHGPRA
ncbi:acyl-CoA dehydrogenase family protein [Oceaniglobus trochenteri]|uniref:acyl-CoA dehydrogenase family protein n=1 Tax=Oceaniglobus trochenteri TaxID=2763260 RepID=UPI001CFF55A7|nr:acyl-CoA dehydrogenase family protein [Oceaniglobus trochenteri]